MFSSDYIRWDANLFFKAISNNFYFTISLTLALQNFFVYFQINLNKSHERGAPACDDCRDVHYQWNETCEIREMKSARTSVRRERSATLTRILINVTFATK